MAGGQERVLRRRIRSVESTKKITRAMELIAASQIVRAQGRIAASRPYVEGISEILRRAAADAGAVSRLVGTPEDPSGVLVLAVVADRGLSGAYNLNVLRATERLVRSGTAAGRTHVVMAVGKKAQGYFRFRGQAVERQFSQMTDRPTFEDARELASAIVPAFLSGEVDLVNVVSTRFISAGNQVVEVRQLLPLVHPGAATGAPAGAGPTGGDPSGSPALELAADESGVTGAEAGIGQHGTPEPAKLGYYEFEPDPAQLLERLVPEYVEAAVYAALLEASASEHTARQRAMSAATENAEELIKTLRRVMNRARQDAITTEIMEIVGGAEALRSASRGSRELNYPLATEEQIA